MLETITYTGKQPGPKFLVLGAVHGNEKCGTVAIKRVISEIESGALEITHGEVTFIPICNPRAYEQDVRFTERNLNRYLVPMEKPDTYEAELGNILCPMLEQCDVLLDIHSSLSESEAFVSLNKTDEQNISFSKSLNAPILLTGWEEAYATTGRQSQTDDNESIGTTEYAQRHKASVAVTLECGQHKDPEAPLTAYRAIHNALRFLGLANKAAVDTAHAPTRHLMFKYVYYRDDDGQFPRNWRNFDPVAKGDVMALRADGSTILAPEDGFITLPKANIPIGQDWFYLAVAQPI